MSKGWLVQDLYSCLVSFRSDRTGPAFKTRDSMRRSGRHLRTCSPSSGPAAPHPSGFFKVTAFIVGAEHQPLFNKIYADAFGDHRPTRSLVPVSGLNNGSLIEIEAIALK